METSESTSHTAVPVTTPLASYLTAASAPYSAPNSYRPDFPFGQCTWLVAAKWKLDGHDDLYFPFTPGNGDARDAKTFCDRARQYGLQVDMTPKLRDAVVITRSPFDGRYGHVAYVTNVYDDGTFEIVQANWPHEPQFLTQDGTYQSKDHIDSTGVECFIHQPDDQRTALRSYLIEKDSPFKYVDILSRCDAAGLARSDCKLLVAITGAESELGTNYRRSSGATDVAGGQAFFNAAGVKRASWHEQPYDPGGTGFNLARFESWEQFWDLYTVGLKRHWIDAGCATPSCFAANGWLTGNRERWIANTTFYLRDIPTI